METLFYVAGIALILTALVISFLGMRSDDFPSRGALRAGVAVMSVIVVVTAYGAVGLAQEEQQHREEEQNEEAALEEEIATADNEASGTLPADPDEAPGPRDETDEDPAAAGGTALAAGDPAAGEQVFIDQTCGSCHSLEAAGDSAVAAIGPNLDESLVDRDPAYIETSIVNPQDEIAEGFSDGIMPVDYGETIPPEELADLVAYLSESTGGGESAAGTAAGGAE